MPRVPEVRAEAPADHSHVIPPPPTLGKARVETLVDGVFAIAMTLLVLEIKVPGGDGPLLPALWALRASFLAYAVSFTNLGVFWVGHHAQFDVVRRTTRSFTWINIGFCAVISLIPFSTALLAQHADERAAVLFYGGNLLVGGLLLYANWRYATDHHRLVEHTIPPALVRLGGLRTLTGTALLLGAMALSFLDTRLAIAIFALIPAYYIFPGVVDRLFTPRT